MSRPWQDFRTIGPAAMYLGDARSIAPALQLSDLGVSDPPYRLTSGGISKDARSMGGKFSGSQYDNSGEIAGRPVAWPEVMDLLYQSLRPDADCYAMCNDKNVHPALDAAFAAGFRQHNLLVWWKSSFTVTRWYNKDCEFVLYLFKGKAKTINDTSSRQLTRQEISRAGNHPAEKPAALLRQYIRNSSQPGETVLDPFMGSGSTGVACIWEGREFIGIEQDPHWYEVACQRVRRAIQEVEACR